jgi:hypothetical protein
MVQAFIVQAQVMVVEALAVQLNLHLSQKAHGVLAVGGVVLRVVAVGHKAAA